MNKHTNKAKPTESYITFRSGEILNQVSCLNQTEPTLSTPPASLKSADWRLRNLRCYRFRCLCFCCRLNFRCWSYDGSFASWDWFPLLCFVFWCLSGSFAGFLRPVAMEEANQSLLDPVGKAFVGFLRIRPYDVAFTTSLLGSI